MYPLPPMQSGGKDAKMKIRIQHENKSIYLEVPDEDFTLMIEADYEHICEIIRKDLKEKQAELLIAIVLDGVSITEYAEREGVSVSAISHRLDTAKKNFKKVFPESSTFPSCQG